MANLAVRPPAPTPEESLARLSAVELAARIARGDVACADAVDAHIARIEQVNPRLNALVVRRYDAARAEARDADRRRAAGDALGPLHGVPIVVEESLDVAGAPSTLGLPSRARSNAIVDDRHVACLRRAGAIVVGKTNDAQLLLRLESDNPLYGHTNNPWNVDRAASATAAAVVAGGPPLGIAVELGGAARVPAALSGAVALHATAGRLPVALAVNAGRALATELGLVGREVADVALALEVANGGRAPSSEPPRPLGDPAAVDLARLRVAWYTDDGEGAPAPAVARAVREAVEVLQSHGAAASAWSPPDASHALATWVGILGADGARGLERALTDDVRDPRVARLARVLAAPAAAIAALRALLGVAGRRRVADLLAACGRHDADHYLELIAAARDHERRFAAALDGDAGGPFDLIVTPACALPAPRHGAASLLAGSHAVLYDLVGYPAGVVPVTRVRAGEELGRAPSRRDALEQAAYETEAGSVGLPVAVQVVARPWREHVALAAMRAVEQALRGRSDHPAAAIAPC
jgi:fatty acid amide hydrolase